MRLNLLSTVAAATALVAVPVAASAQPVANPAASLSVAKSARVSTVSEKKSALGGGGAVAALILAGVAAIGIIAIVNDGDDSDSN